MRTIRLTIPLALLAATGLSLSSCQEKEVIEVKGQVSGEVLEQIQAHGYSTVGVQKVPEGVIVEGDILLTPADLASRPQPNSLTVGADEHYWSNLKVASYPSSIRTIKVRVRYFANTGVYAKSYDALLDLALRRYNDVSRSSNLYINFVRVNSTDNSANITIEPKNDVWGFGVARFPSDNGNPGSKIYINQTSVENADNGSYRNEGSIVSLITHEMGHAIGFRHTDMKTRESCNENTDETQNTTISFPGDVARTIGYAYIPGTVGGTANRTSNSWMLACQYWGGDRPFTEHDKTALKYLYRR